mmetsp:Transcript_76690/g.201234  ORF Transcript_76690/g.201234 Transcript_76690/m.201234 type:complete len:381 (+) Transcript_76690:3-1145(+)
MACPEAGSEPLSEDRAFVGDVVGPVPGRRRLPVARAAQLAPRLAAALDEAELLLDAECRRVAHGEVEHVVYKGHVISDAQVPTQEAVVKRLEHLRGGPLRAVLELGLQARREGRRPACLADPQRPAAGLSRDLLHLLTHLPHQLRHVAARVPAGGGRDRLGALVAAALVHQQVRVEVGVHVEGERKAVAVRAGRVVQEAGDASLPRDLVERLSAHCRAREYTCHRHLLEASSVELTDEALESPPKASGLPAVCEALGLHVALELEQVQFVSYGQAHDALGAQKGRKLLRPGPPAQIVSLAARDLRAEEDAKVVGDDVLFEGAPRILPARLPPHEVPRLEQPDRLDGRVRVRPHLRDLPDAILVRCVVQGHALLRSHGHGP